MNAMTPAERFAVALTPDPTVARIARQRSTLRLQVIFALVFVAVLLLVWVGPQMLPEDARRVVQGALPSWSLPALPGFWAALRSPPATPVVGGPDWNWWYWPYS